MEGYITWNHRGSNGTHCADVERNSRARLREVPANPLRKGKFYAASCQKVL